MSEENFSFLSNSRRDRTAAQSPPTLVIRENNNRFLFKNSIYLVITTALISAVDSWGHPVSQLFFAVMVLKFLASILSVYVKNSITISKDGVRVSFGRIQHWEQLIDFYLEAEVPGESPESLVVILKGGEIFKVLDYRFNLIYLDADREDIVAWVRFYERYFRK